MLQKLNERIQGVVAWVIIVLVAVTFTLFGIDYYVQSRHESNVQVEVNGEPITKQAFEMNYRRARQMRDPALMSIAFEKQLRKQVMDQMVMQKVSMQSALHYGFNVNIEQANAAILSISQFQQDGRFSTDRYQQVLNGAFFTPESFQKEVSQGMLLNQQRFAFMGTSFALPNEIQQFVKLYMQTRDYGYLQIPASRFIKEANVSKADIASYYEKHKQDFLSPEKVTVDYIRLSMADLRKSVKVPDGQVQRYYEENKSNYYTPTQWKLAHILIAVATDASLEEQKRAKHLAEETYRELQKNPSHFEQAVRTVSDDKISIAKAGVLPWIVAGQSEFDKALVNLSTPGQISAPFKSSHGYELFKLIAYKPSTVKPLSEVSAEIKEQLTLDLVQAKYAKTLERLTDLSYQMGDSLSSVADTLKLNVQESDPFSRQGGDSDLTKNKQVINASFSHDVLDLGNNSEPVQLDNDSVVVVRINKHIPAAEKSLAEVSAAIVKTLALQRAKLEAKHLGKALLAVSQNPAQQEKMIMDSSLQWNPVTMAGRDNDTSSELINEMAFNLSRVGEELGRSMDNGDYVIVHLKKINDGKLDTLDKEQAASITQQIEANYGLMDYDLYVNDLINKAKLVKSS
jgi:peptidyl-prolyl cis-trans isomerase D